VKELTVIMNTKEVVTNNLPLQNKLGNILHVTIWGKERDIFKTCDFCTERSSWTKWQKSVDTYHLIIKSDSAMVAKDF